MGEKMSSDEKLRACCQYIIKLAEKDGIDLSNKKLQKILYIAQCYSIYLVKQTKDKKRSKLLDHKFEVWVHGAVIPQVYRMYRQFGYNNIYAKIDEGLIGNLPDVDRKLLDAVWHCRRQFDVSYLEYLNHEEDIAWQKRAGGRTLEYGLSGLYRPG